MMADLGEVYLARKPFRWHASWGARYHGNRRVRKMPAYEQLLVLAIAQLTWHECLRDIEICLASFGPKLYHAGLRQLLCYG